jgi:hypothetical protein
MRFGHRQVWIDRDTSGDDLRAVIDAIKKGDTKAVAVSKSRYARSKSTRINLETCEMNIWQKYRGQACQPSVKAMRVLDTEGAVLTKWLWEVWWTDASWPDTTLKNWGVADTLRDVEDVCGIVADSAPAFFPTNISN